MSPRDIDLVMDLVASCLRNGVRFHGTPGVLMIELGGLPRVLSDVAQRYRVLGFDTVTIDGLAVRPRLDYYTDFGEAVEVTETLEAISAWPRDKGLWVEALVDAK